MSKKSDPDHTQTVQIPAETIAEIAAEWRQMTSSERPTVDLRPAHTRRSRAVTERLA